MPKPRPERIALSHAQRRLWFVDQFQEEGDPGYHIPLVFRLPYEVDADALRLAMADVVARHESLRTVFPDDDGDGDDGPWQHILRPGEREPELTVAVRSGTEAERLLAAEVRRPFDITGDLPLRGTLLRPAQGRETTLLLVLHHIAADGWSLTSLCRDLSRAYRARLAGTAPEFAPLPLQYADYAVWHRELLGDPGDPGSVLSGQLRYWERRLSGLPEEVSPP
ncbi:condensation domain-containing protein, partial [Streptosporangium algeriense]